VQREPLQGDGADGAAQLPALQHRQRVVPGEGAYQDVLALARQPEDAAGACEVGPAQEAGAHLGGPAWADQEFMHADQLAELQAGFFLRLAPHEVLDAFARLDDAGDRLPEPGMQPGGERAAAHLADQDHLVAHRIVGQDGGDRAALEHLALDDLAHAAAIGRMPIPVCLYLEIALERGPALDQVDFFVVGHGDIPRGSEKGRSAREAAPSGSEGGIRTPDPAVNSRLLYH
jgi:hypothetical protein